MLILYDESRLQTRELFTQKCQIVYFYDNNINYYGYQITIIINADDQRHSYYRRFFFKGSQITIILCYITFVIKNYKKKKSQDRNA